MPVMKRQESSPLLQRAIVLEMGDLGCQAEQLKEGARLEAATIVTAAEQEAERVAAQIGDEAQRQGHAEGFERGLAEGRKRGCEEAIASAAAQFEQLQRSWIDAAQQWEQRHQEMQSQGRRDVLALALRLAELVVHRIVQVDRSVVVDQLAAALSYVLRSMEVTVRIHRDDRQLLEQAMPQLIAEFSQVKSLSLVDDDQIDRGGCVISYGQGQVDATVETQLRRLVMMILPDPEQAAEDRAKNLPQDSGATAPQPQDDSERDDDSV